VPKIKEWNLIVRVFCKQKKAEKVSLRQEAPVKTGAVIPNFL